MSGLRRLAVAMLCALPAFPAAALQGFKGEFDLEGSQAGNRADSLDAALGERDHGDLSGWLRLMWQGGLAAGWDLDVAYLAEARHGGGVALDRAQRAYLPDAYVDPRRTALLRMDQVVTDHGDDWLDQRIDRLAVGYGNDKLVLRVGRQALTWGSGLVFHAMDLFDPFPPNATYTAYKPGTDMFYGQWLFDDGADVQGVVVPRRDPDTGKPEGGQSSAGIKWHGFVGPDQSLGIDLLLARDYRDQVLGLGLSGSLAGATWSAEVVPTRLDGGGMRSSGLANAQYAWTWGTRNVSAYLEYYRNGFGMGGAPASLANLPVPLADRLARGELYTVAKDYLAVGADLQWTPLLDLKPSLLANLDDGSALLIGQAVYSLSQDTALTLGLQWGLGGRGTEYGGLAVAPGSDVYAAPARRAYARFSWYF